MKNFIDIIKENSSGNYNEAESTATERATAARKMAALCKELEAVVVKMSNVYEEHRFMNDIQPRDFSAVIAGSLDEWHFGLSAVAEDWEEIANKADNDE